MEQTSHMYTGKPIEEVQKPVSSLVNQYEERSKSVTPDRDITTPDRIMIRQDQDRLVEAQQATRMIQRFESQELLEQEPVIGSLDEELIGQEEDVSGLSEEEFLALVEKNRVDSGPGSDSEAATPASNEPDHPLDSEVQVDSTGTDLGVQEQLSEPEAVIEKPSVVPSVGFDEIVKSEEVPETIPDVDILTVSMTKEESSIEQAQPSEMAETTKVIQSETQTVTSTEEVVVIETPEQSEAVQDTERMKDFIKPEEPKVVTPEEPNIVVRPETEDIDITTQAVVTSPKEKPSPTPIIITPDEGKDIICAVAEPAVEVVKPATTETEHQERPSTLDTAGPVLDILVVEQAAHSTELLSPTLRIPDEEIVDLDDAEFADLVADNQLEISPVEESSSKVIAADAEKPENINETLIKEVDAAIKETSIEVTIGKEEELTSLEAVPAVMVAEQQEHKETEEVKEVSEPQIVMQTKEENTESILSETAEVAQQTQQTDEQELKETKEETKEEPEIEEPTPLEVSDDKLEQQAEVVSPIQQVDLQDTKPKEEVETEPTEQTEQTVTEAYEKPVVEEVKQHILEQTITLVKEQEVDDGSKENVDDHIDEVHHVKPVEQEVPVESSSEPEVEQPLQLVQEQVSSVVGESTKEDIAPAPEEVVQTTQEPQIVPKEVQAEQQEQQTKTQVETEEEVQEGQVGACEIQVEPAEEVPIPGEKPTVDQQQQLVDEQLMQKSIEDVKAIEKEQSIEEPKSTGVREPTLETSVTQEIPLSQVKEQQAVPTEVKEEILSEPETEMAAQTDQVKMESSDIAVAHTVMQADEQTESLPESTIDATDITVESDQVQVKVEVPTFEKAPEPIPSVEIKEEEFAAKEVESIGETQPEVILNKQDEEITPFEEEKLQPTKLEPDTNQTVTPEEILKEEIASQDSQSEIVPELPQSVTQLSEHVEEQSGSRKIVQDSVHTMEKQTEDVVPTETLVSDEPDVHTSLAEVEPDEKSIHSVDEETVEEESVSESIVYESEQISESVVEDEGMDVIQTTETAEETEEVAEDGTITKQKITKTIHMRQQHGKKDAVGVEIHTEIWQVPPGVEEPYYGENLRTETSVEEFAETREDGTWSRHQIVKTTVQRLPPDAPLLGEPEVVTDQIQQQPAQDPMPPVAIELAVSDTVLQVSKEPTLDTEPAELTEKHRLASSSYENIYTNTQFTTEQDEVEITADVIGDRFDTKHIESHLIKGDGLSSSYENVYLESTESVDVSQALDKDLTQTIETKDIEDVIKVTAEISPVQAEPEPKSVETPMIQEVTTKVELEAIAQTTEPLDQPTDKSVSEEPVLQETAPPVAAPPVESSADSAEVKPVIEEHIETEPLDKPAMLVPLEKADSPVEDKIELTQEATPKEKSEAEPIQEDPIVQDTQNTQEEPEKEVINVDIPVVEDQVDANVSVKPVIHVPVVTSQGPEEDIKVTTEITPVETEPELKPPVEPIVQDVTTKIELEASVLTTELLDQPTDKSVTEEPVLQEASPPVEQVSSADSPTEVKPVVEEHIESEPSDKPAMPVPIEKPESPVEKVIKLTSEVSLTEPSEAESIQEDIIVQETKEESDAIAPVEHESPEEIITGHTLVVEDQVDAEVSTKPVIHVPIDTPQGIEDIKVTTEITPVEAEPELKPAVEEPIVQYVTTEVKLEASIQTTELLQQPTDESVTEEPVLQEASPPVEQVSSADSPTEVNPVIEEYIESEPSDKPAMPVPIEKLESPVEEVIKLTSEVGPTEPSEAESIQEDIIVQETKEESEAIAPVEQESPEEIITGDVPIVEDQVEADVSVKPVIHVPVDASQDLEVDIKVTTEITPVEAEPELKPAVEEPIVQYVTTEVKLEASIQTTELLQQPTDESVTEEPVLQEASPPVEQVSSADSPTEVNPVIEEYIKSEPSDKPAMPVPIEKLESPVEEVIKLTSEVGPTEPSEAESIQEDIIVQETKEESEAIAPVEQESPEEIITGDVPIVEDQVEADVSVKPVIHVPVDASQDLEVDIKVTTEITPVEAEPELKPAVEEPIVQDVTTELEASIQTTELLEHPTDESVTEEPVLQEASPPVEQVSSADSPTEVNPVIEEYIESKPSDKPAMPVPIEKPESPVEEVIKLTAEVSPTEPSEAESIQEDIIVQETKEESEAIAPVEQESPEEIITGDVPVVEDQVEEDVSVKPVIHVPVDASQDLEVDIKVTTEITRVEAEPELKPAVEEPIVQDVTTEVELEASIQTTELLEHPTDKSVTEEPVLLEASPPVEQVSSADSPTEVNPVIEEYIESEPSDKPAMTVPIEKPESPVEEVIKLTSEVSPTEPSEAESIQEDVIVQETKEESEAIAPVEQESPEVIITGDVPVDDDQVDAEVSTKPIIHVPIVTPQDLEEDIKVTTKSTPVEAQPELKLVVEEPIVQDVTTELEASTLTAELLDQPTDKSVTEEPVLQEASPPVEQVSSADSPTKVKPAIEKHIESEPSDKPAMPVPIEKPESPVEENIKLTSEVSPTEQSEAKSIQEDPIVQDPQETKEESEAIAPVEQESPEEIITGDAPVDEDQVDAEVSTKPEIHVPMGTPQHLEEDIKVTTKITPVEAEPELKLAVEEPIVQDVTTELEASIQTTELLDQPTDKSVTEEPVLQEASPPVEQVSSADSPTEVKPVIEEHIESEPSDKPAMTVPIEKPESPVEEIIMLTSEVSPTEQSEAKQIQEDPIVQDTQETKEESEAIALVEQESPEEIITGDILVVEDQVDAEVSTKPVIHVPIDTPQGIEDIKVTTEITPVETEPELKPAVEEPIVQDVTTEVELEASAQRTELLDQPTDESVTEEPVLQEASPPVEQISSADSPTEVKPVIEEHIESEPSDKPAMPVPIEKPESPVEENIKLTAEVAPTEQAEAEPVQEEAIREEPVIQDDLKQVEQEPKKSVALEQEMMMVEPLKEVDSLLIESDEQQPGEETNVTPLAVESDDKGSVPCLIESLESPITKSGSAPVEAAVDVSVCDIKPVIDVSDAQTAVDTLTAVSDNKDQDTEHSSADELSVSEDVIEPVHKERKSDAFAQSSIEFVPRDISEKPAFGNIVDGKDDEFVVEAPSPQLPATPDSEQTDEETVCESPIQPFFRERSVESAIEKVVDLPDEKAAKEPELEKVPEEKQSDESLEQSLESDQVQLADVPVSPVAPIKQTEPEESVEVPVEKGPDPVLFEIVQPPKQSEVPQHIQSPPTCFDEVEEVLPDGTCIKRKLIKAKVKRIVTRKVRKVGPDGNVVEDVITEELPESEMSETSSLRSSLSGSQGGILSPVQSITSPAELMSPTDSVSSRASIRVYTDTIESEPQVETDVKEFEETLPDGRVIIRKVIKRRQKQTIVKRVVLEGPHPDDALQPSISGAVTPEMHVYADTASSAPKTTTETQVVAEVQPDGSVVQKTVTKSTEQSVKTERTVMESPAYVPGFIEQPSGYVISSQVPVMAEQGPEEQAFVASSESAPPRQVIEADFDQFVTQQLEGVPQKKAMVKVSMEPSAVEAQETFEPETQPQEELLPLEDFEETVEDVYLGNEEDEEFKDAGAPPSEEPVDLPVDERTPLEQEKDSVVEITGEDAELKSQDSDLVEKAEIEDISDSGDISQEDVEDLPYNDVQKDIDKLDKDDVILTHTELKDTSEIDKDVIGSEVVERQEKGIEESMEKDKFGFDDLKSLSVSLSEQEFMVVMSEESVHDSVAAESNILGTPKTVGGGGGSDVEITKTDTDKHGKFVDISEFEIRQEGSDRQEFQEPIVQVSVESAPDIAISETPVTDPYAVDPHEPSDKGPTFHVEDTEHPTPESAMFDDATLSSGLIAPSIAIVEASPLVQSPTDDQMYSETKEDTDMEKVREITAGIEAEQKDVKIAKTVETETQSQSYSHTTTTTESETIHYEDLTRERAATEAQSKLEASFSLEAQRGSQPPSDLDSQEVSPSGDDEEAREEKRPLSPTDYTLETDLDLEPEGRLGTDTSQQIFIEQSIEAARASSGSVSTPGEERPPSPSDYTLIPDDELTRSMTGSIPEDVYSVPEPLDPSSAKQEDVLLAERPDFEELSARDVPTTCQPVTQSPGETDTTDTAQLLAEECITTGTNNIH